MTYEDLVKEVCETFVNADVSQVEEHIAYQFNVTGEAEGAFYLEISEGKLKVEPYDYNDRDALFTATADTLLKIAKGELGALQAYEQDLLKVEGNLDKALMLQDFVQKQEAAQEPEVTEAAKDEETTVQADEVEAKEAPAEEETITAADTTEEVTEDTTETQALKAEEVTAEDKDTKTDKIQSRKIKKAVGRKNSK